MDYRGNIEGLVAELDRQRATRVDVVLPSTSFCFGHSTDASINPLIFRPTTPQAAEFFPTTGLPLRKAALLQLCDRLEPSPPSRYVQDLADKAPAILGRMLNGLMLQCPWNANRWLIRCLDNQVRAVLSSKYRILDSYDLAFSAFDHARHVGAQVVECTLSDSRMRLKFVRANTAAVISDQQRGGIGADEYVKRLGFRPDPNSPPGTVHPYIIISNSETGEGGLNVEHGLLEPRCANGLVIDRAINVVHLGAALRDGVLSEETIAADSKAIMLKVRDHIAAAFSNERFQKMVDRARNAAADLLPNPIAATDNLVKNASLSTSLRDAILSHFVKDYSPNRMGLASAVSRTAQDLESSEDTATLEALAGELIISPKLLAAAT